uniref:Uncharacterized protein n=1 Tax=Arundo donax TaxID=35708 RepID=A0A0A9G932_ARUDO
MEGTILLLVRSSRWYSCGIHLQAVPLPSLAAILYIYK